MELSINALNIALPLDSLVSGPLMYSTEGAAEPLHFGVQNIQVMPGIKNIHMHTYHSGGFATKRCPWKMDENKCLFVWSAPRSVKDILICYCNIQLVLGPIFYY